MAPSMLPVTVGYTEESWVWDANAKSPAAELSPCQQAVYFHIDPIVGSQGTAGVRGTRVQHPSLTGAHDPGLGGAAVSHATFRASQPFLRPNGFTQGEHYWEIDFLEPPYGLSVMLGVGTQRALLHAGNHTYINLLGKDSESWGLSYKGFLWHEGASRCYTEPFYDRRTVIGVHLNLTEGTLTFLRNGQSLGLAFTGLNKVRSPLYPMVCSTAAGTELQVGLRRCRLPSLQESCLSTVSQNLLDDALADMLPLPRAVRGLLKHFSGKTAHAITSAS